MQHPPPDLSERLRAGIDAALARPVMLVGHALESVRTGATFLAPGTRPILGFNDRVLGYAGESSSTKPPPYTREGDVAVVTIEGALAQRAWSCGSFFGGDGYDAIASRVRAAMADTSTRSVLLVIDSPGGEVAGCAEGAQAIRAAADEAGKPMVAYADEMICSAAYWLACTADAIVAPPSACVGSIGVLAQVSERSRANDAAGVSTRVIRSGVKKAVPSSVEPMTDAAVALVQMDVDSLARQFATHVSASRGLTVDGVLGLEGAAFLGDEAKANGLIDVVGGRSAALAKARALAATRTNTTARAAATRSGESMDTTQKALVGLAADATEAQQADRLTALAALDRDARKLTEATDTEGARGALHSMAKRATQADALEATLRDERAAAEKRERGEMKSAALEAHILAPADVDANGEGAESEWLAGMSNTALRGFIDRSKRLGQTVVPSGEARQPADGAIGAQLPTSVAALAAKGWAKLSADEKHAVEAHDSKLAARLRAAAK